jgi:hypothetical protein
MQADCGTGDGGQGVEIAARNRPLRESQRPLNPKTAAREELLSRQLILTILQFGNDASGAANTQTAVRKGKADRKVINYPAEFVPGGSIGPVWKG